MTFSLAGQRGQQLKTLENKPNFLSAQPGSLVFVQGTEGLSIEPDLACRRDIHAR
jgi:hypothetical protein